MPWTSQIKYNWRLCKTNFEREAEQLRQWRHWRNGRIRANAFLSWSPHPGTIGLPLFFRGVLFPSFFIFLQLLAKESIRRETADKCHICMFKVTWAGPCFEKSPQPFDVEKLCWCNNIKACNWYYAKHSNSMFCQKKRVNEGILAFYYICHLWVVLENRKWTTLT